MTQEEKKEYVEHIAVDNYVGIQALCDKGFSNNADHENIAIEILTRVTELLSAIDSIKNK